DHARLPSFPTRRSSDLCAPPALDSSTAPGTLEKEHNLTQLGRHAPPGGVARMENHGRPYPAAAVDAHCRAAAHPEHAQAEKAHRSEEHTSELQSRENLV